MSCVVSVCVCAEWDVRRDEVFQHLEEYEAETAGFVESLSKYNLDRQQQVCLSVCVVSSDGTQTHPPTHTHTSWPRVCVVCTAGS